MKKTGIILLNLGTPDAPQTPEVKRYLREFLSDPYVIDISALPRWLLVNLVIAPFRASRSAEAYRKIWTNEGSPLLTHHLELTKKVKRKLGDSVPVVAGMRYGKPSLASAIQVLLELNIERIILFPLYPQYAMASTESSAVFFESLMEELAPEVERWVIPPFYRHSGYIQSFAELGKAEMAKKNFDHVLFSYHGVPVRQITKVSPACLNCRRTEKSCLPVNEDRQYCYRSHCFETTEALAQSLGLEPSKYSVSFQSRLGRTPWVEPYTDFVIPDLAKSGVKNLLVYSPSFVSDCLETLEEIAIRGKELFIENGGEDLVLVESLNSHAHWADSVSEMIREEL